MEEFLVADSPCCRKAREDCLVVVRAESGGLILTERSGKEVSVVVVVVDLGDKRLHSALITAAGSILVGSGYAKYGKTIRKALARTHKVYAPVHLGLITCESVKRVLAPGLAYLEHVGADTAVAVAH